MPDTRDRVEKNLREIIIAAECFGRHSSEEVWYEGSEEAENDYTDQILSIPELAIVDREAELPRNHWIETIEQHKAIGIDPQTAIDRKLGYAEAQQDMLKAGWIKGVKDGASSK